MTVQIKRKLTDLLFCRYYDDFVKRLEKNGFTIINKTRLDSLERNFKTTNGKIFKELNQITN